MMLLNHTEIIIVEPSQVLRYGKIEKRQVGIKQKNMSCCKECPYKVDNNHNRKLREFTERTGRKHTCHMVNPKLWDTSNEKEMCKNFD
jgi:hypothetical protein